MKKLLAMLLTVIALFSLAACSDAASPKTDPPAQEAAPAEPTAVPEPGGNLRKHILWNMGGRLCRAKRHNRNR